MNIRFVKFLVMALVLFLILLSAGIVMAGQASSYTEINLVDGQCEQYVYNTAIGGGFTDVVVNNPSVTFNSGPYQCAGRCITKHNIVFFYCVGPSSEEAHGIVESMKMNGPWMQ